MILISSSLLPPNWGVINSSVLEIMQMPCRRLYKHFTSSPPSFVHVISSWSLTSSESLQLTEHKARSDTWSERLNDSENDNDSVGGKRPENQLEAFIHRPNLRRSCGAQKKWRINEAENTIINHNLCVYFFPCVFWSSRTKSLSLNASRELNFLINFWFHHPNWYFFSLPHLIGSELLLKFYRY